MKLPASPKVLISRGDVLGDVMVTTPLIKPLKKAFPSCKIYYLVRRDYIPLLENIEEIDGFIEDDLPYKVGLKDWKKMLALAREIQQKQCNLFIGLWESPSYGLLAKLAGIKVRIGHAFSFWNKYFYSHTVKLDYLDYGLHKVDYNLSLLKPLGIELTTPEKVLLKTSAVVEASLVGQFPFLKEPYVAVHLDAGNPQRILLDQHFIQVVQYLIEKGVPKIVLFGREHNKQTAEAIVKACKNDSSIANWTGELSLAQIQVVIAKAQHLISSDSGPVHIASGFQVPVLVYYFNRIQNALHWGPWQTPHIIVKSHHHCTDQCRPTVCRKLDCREPVSIDEFKIAIDQLWSGARPHETDQRSYWMKTSMTIGLMGEKKRKLKSYLEDEGWILRELDENQSIKSLENTLSDHNINLIVYAGTPSLRKRLKIELARRWVANRIHFFPIVFKVDNPFDFEQKIAQWVAPLS